MPKVSAEYGQQQKARIIKGAALAFAEKGFQQTSIDYIANSLGLSKGAIYIYFDKKETLFMAAYEDHLNRRLATLRQVCDPTLPVMARLERVLDQFTAVLVNYDAVFARLWLEFWLEIPRIEAANKLANQMQQEFYNLLYGLLEEGQQRREIKAGLDIASITSVILATCDGLLLNVLTRHQVTNAAEIRHALWNTYCNLLKAN